MHGQSIVHGGGGIVEVVVVVAVVVGETVVVVLGGGGEVLKQGFEMRFNLGSPSLSELPLFSTRIWLFSTFVSNLSPN